MILPLLSAGRPGQIPPALLPRPLSPTSADVTAFRFALAAGFKHPPPFC
jgi:hypothetical protein